MLLKKHEALHADLEGFKATVAKLEEQRAQLKVMWHHGDVWNAMLLITKGCGSRYDNNTFSIRPCSDAEHRWS